MYHLPLKTLKFWYNVFYSKTSKHFKCVYSNWPLLYKCVMKYAHEINIFDFVFMCDCISLHLSLSVSVLRSQYWSLSLLSASLSLYPYHPLCFCPTLMGCHLLNLSVGFPEQVFTGTIHVECDHWTMIFGWSEHHDVMAWRHFRITGPLWFIWMQGLLII